MEGVVISFLFRLSKNRWIALLSFSSYEKYPNRARKTSPTATDYCLSAQSQGNQVTQLFHSICLTLRKQCAGPHRKMFWRARCRKAVGLAKITLAIALVCTTQKVLFSRNVPPSKDGINCERLSLSIVVDPFALHVNIRKIGRSST